MSMRYKGAVISATPPTTSQTSASGAWTLEQQMQATAAGLWPRNGPFNYIEDVFSTWLYTGNDSTQTINNGIDLAGKGGLVWTKRRSGAAANHILFDTSRGALSGLFSDTTNAAISLANTLTSFNSNGFTLGSDSSVNGNPNTFASWTFRDQPRFFDVVTYTGNGATNRAVAHNLGSTPGCIIIKSITNAGSAELNTWRVWHRSLEINRQLVLNNANAQEVLGNFVAQDSTTFTITGTGVNNNGTQYVAYLFAHNAGGFGLTGNENVITCGSWTGTGGQVSVNLGYEPQWLLFKRTNASGFWTIYDNMRGVPTGGGTAQLWPNSSDAEESATNQIDFNATGFTIKNTGALSVNGGVWIYIAIRRGPMAVPTTGTSVFAPVAQNGGNGTGVVTTNFPVDFSLSRLRGFTGSFMAVDRLRGARANGPMARLSTADTTAEASNLSNGFGFDNNTGYLDNWFSANPVIYENFRRAPGFFDVVCYTGTGSARTVAHNLGVVPELMIVKARNEAGYGWRTYAAALGPTKNLQLNLTDAETTLSTVWNNTAPTASVFTIGTSGAVNTNTTTYVAYLFASCPGVSKVGSYTGNGNTAAQGGQTINCGFTGSARFILIKCTSSAENWYVWDSARGIVPGNDPSLTLNTTAAEDAGYDAVDAVAGGFIVNNNNASNINTSGQTYIFLAIA